MKDLNCFRPTLVVAALAAVLPASAITLTIDTPNVTLARPTSGTLTYLFQGIATANPGETINYVGFTAPTNATHSYAIPATLSPDIFGKATYTGTLFSVTLDATTPLGYYGYGATSGNLSYLEIDDNEGFAEDYYSVTVTQAVPEPASFAALGLGALALLRRRRHA